MKPRKFPAGFPLLITLAIAQAKDRRASVPEIRDAIKRATGVDITTGGIFSALDTLRAKKEVDRRSVSTAAHQENGRQKKQPEQILVFELSALGIERLKWFIRSVDVLMPDWIVQANDNHKG